MSGKIFSGGAWMRVVRWTRKVSALVAARPRRATSRPATAIETVLKINLDLSCTASNLSGRSAEPRLYLHVERGAPGSTFPICFLHEYLARCRQCFDFIRRGIPQQCRSDDNEEQRRPEHLKQAVQKPLVIK